MVFAVEGEAVLREVLVVEPSEDGRLGVVGANVEDLQLTPSMYGSKRTRSSAAIAFLFAPFNCRSMISGVIQRVGRSSSSSPTRSCPQQRKREGPRRSTAFQWPYGVNPLEIVLRGCADGVRESEQRFDGLGVGR